MHVIHILVCYAFISNHYKYCGFQDYSLGLRPWAHLGSGPLGSFKLWDSLLDAPPQALPLHRYHDGCHHVTDAWQVARSTPKIGGLTIPLKGVMQAYPIQIMMSFFVSHTTPLINYESQFLKTYNTYCSKRSHVICRKSPTIFLCLVLPFQAHRVLPKWPSPSQKARLICFGTCPFWTS
jgi:hypothetical protein